jgi:hypothetical protein
VGADTSETLDSVKDISSTSFGYFIAFLLPGIFGMYALSRWFPELSATLQPIFKPDTSIGPSFVFLAVAIGAGVCISGIRFFIFEKAIFHKRKAPKYKGLDADGLARQRAIVDEHYRYHQFYGNCAVAALILYAGWVRNWHHSLWQSFGWTLGIIMLETLLIASAWDCFIRYDDCRKPEEQPRGAAK